MACIEARGLRKAFGANVALDRIDLTVQEGRIFGLIGPNGAGKTTALKAILGLTPYEGELRVLGRNPYTERNELMQDVCFIADVAVLPPWIKVSQALDFAAGVHPRFDRARAEGFLSKTSIPKSSKVHKLSKGMITQLHLALVMAIDAKLLVLDEPTLGLDILYRKQFYDTLLNDYFDRNRTILVTTHQVEEIQHVLTDLLFIDRGRIVLNSTMEEFESRYVEVMVTPEHTCGRTRPRAAARTPGFRPQHPAVRTPRSEQARRAGRAANSQYCRSVRRFDRRSETPRSGSMSANANALPDATATSTTAPLRTRPFLWSVKRELWENRSLYIAPLAVATLLLLAVVVSYVQGRGITISIPEATQVSPDRFRSVSLGAFAVCAGIMTVTMFFVSLFYLLDSLHGERKDRSVLFWKSLPVSDTTTVLSKLVTGRRHCSVDRSGHRFRSLHGPVAWRGCGARGPGRSRRESARQCRNPGVSGGRRVSADRRRRCGMRRSAAGCCSCLRGRGARRFCGPCCRLRRSRLRNTSRSARATFAMRSTTVSGPAWPTPSIRDQGFRFRRRAPRMCLRTISPTR